MRNDLVRTAKRAWSTLLDLELLESALAFAGAASALTGLAQFVWPSLPSSLGSRMALAVLFLSCTALLVLQASRQALTAVPRGLDWRIEACVGDILDEKVRVLTADRTFTTSLEIIGNSSLLGQLLDRAEPDARDAYQTALAAARSGAGVHPPGHVVTISNAECVTFVLAVGTSSTSGSVTTWHELWQAYDGLWGHMRGRNADWVAMPVIGAGYSGTSLDHGAVLASIITSFHSSSIERVIVPRLRIVIAPSMASAIRPCGRLLSSLGYDVKYRRRLR